MGGGGVHYQNMGCRLNRLGGKVKGHGDCAGVLRQ